MSGSGMDGSGQDTSTGDNSTGFSSNESGSSSESGSSVHMQGLQVGCLPACGGAIPNSSQHQAELNFCAG